MTKGQENAGGAMKYDEKWQVLSSLPDYIPAHCNTRH
jgi:hypothetical protein